MKLDLFACGYCGEVVELHRAVGMNIEDCGCQTTLPDDLKNIEKINEKTFILKTVGLKRTIDLYVSQFIRSQPDVETLIPRLRIIAKQYLVLAIKRILESKYNNNIQIIYQDDFMSNNIILHLHNISALEDLVSHFLFENKREFPKQDFMLDAVVVNDHLYIHILNRF